MINTITSRTERMVTGVKTIILLENTQIPRKIGIMVTGIKMTTLVEKENNATTLSATRTPRTIISVPNDQDPTLEITNTRGERRVHRETELRVNFPAKPATRITMINRTERTMMKRRLGNSLGIE